MSSIIDETNEFIRAYWKSQKQKDASRRKVDKNKKCKEIFCYVRKTKVDTSNDEGKSNVPCSPISRSKSQARKCSSNRYGRHTFSYSSDSSSERSFIHSSPKFDVRSISPKKSSFRKNAEHSRHGKSSKSEALGRSSSYDVGDAHPSSRSKSRARRSSNCCRRHDSSSSSECERHRRPPNPKIRHSHHHLQHSRSNRSRSVSPHPHQQKLAKPCLKRERSASSRARKYHASKSQPRDAIDSHSHRSRLVDRGCHSSRKPHPVEKIDGRQKERKVRRSPSLERWSQSPAGRKYGRPLTKDLVKRQKTERESLSRYSSGKTDKFHGKAREDRFSASPDEGCSKRRQEELLKKTNLKKHIEKWILSNDDGPACIMSGPTYRNTTLPHIKREPNDYASEKLLKRDASRYLDRSKGDFFCKLCDSHMNNVNMWEQHIRGQRHAKNIKKLPGESLCKMKSVKLHLARSKLEEKIYQEASGELIVGLDFIRETRVPAGEIYNCFLCGSCSTNYDILQHVRLPKHRKNYLEQLGIFGESNIKKNCFEMLKKYGRGRVEVYQSKN